MEYAPICLFTYNRYNETRKTIINLKQNYKANETVLYIFSDGWKNNFDRNKVNKVREIFKSLSGFKDIIVFESNENLGLAKSIINGVTKVINRHGKTIVLEDDLLTSKNFILYMNACLEKYEMEKKVWSISAYSYQLKNLQESKFDIEFGYRASSWGWATWERTWERIDWDENNICNIKLDREQRNDFKNKCGSDIYAMLKKRTEKRIDSWAIIFVYNQFINNCFDVYPTVSKVVNIGFSDDATNTKSSKNRYKTSLDTQNQIEFRFPNVVDTNKSTVRQFSKKFSFMTRIKYKIISSLNI